MKLPYLGFGDPSNPPLVLVHGLFGQGKNLAAIGRGLSKSHYVMSVDLRNHGNAPWSDIHDYEALADDIYESFVPFGAIHLLGHSMGGKAAMMLALTRPDFVKALLVADIAPVSYHHSYDEMIGAMRGLDLSQIQNRRAADAALAASIPDQGTRAFLLHSLQIDGVAKWQFNLESLRENMPHILGWPDINASYEGSTLFVGGDNSDYISNQNRNVIKQYFPTAKIITIKNAGHWLHVEQPEIFTSITRNFFANQISSNFQKEEYIK